MGNYMFQPDALVDVLRDVSEEGLEPDFGRTIVPRMIEDPTHRVCAYDFLRNVVPGLKPYEEPGYWRDVGTLETYWAAHMDLLGAQPRFDLNNRGWPIHSQAYHRASPKILGGSIEDVTIGVGSVIDNARIVRSVIGRDTFVAPGAEIVDSVVMDHCRIGEDSRLHRAIVDRYNVLPPESAVAADAASRPEGATVADDLIVLPRGKTRPL
jgi:glucose-1-phosphate adenylyltransferase